LLTFYAQLYYTLLFVIIGSDQSKIFVKKTARFFTECLPARKCTWLHNNAIFVTKRLSMSIF